MTETKPNELLIRRGDTFSMVVMWEDRDLIIRKAITAISLAFGAPRLTVAEHGIHDGWRGFVSMVEGMKEINAENIPPRDSDFHVITVIDASTIELNSVTPVRDNGQKWSAYTTGGFINFYSPQDLTGHTARMKIKDRIGGTVLASSEVADAPLNIIALAVSPSNKKTTVTITATDSAAIAFKRGVTDLEMVSPVGVVTKLKLTTGAKGEPDEVRVTGEVTT
jgi:hypothetical protein